MPWFGKSEEEKERDRVAEGAKQRREASEAALAAGGIPLEATKRLQDLKTQGGSFFTSDLSVNEFLLARQARLTPLSQVMGSSVYHVGWRQITWGTPTGELWVVSDAIRAARQAALSRMAQEAALVGAHVVAGVRPAMERYEWARGSIEFSFVGTAMRLEGVAAPEVPSLTNLSGQDVWKLYTGGFWPLGVVAGSSVFHVVPTWGRWLQSSWGGWFNQEMTEFTAGLYAARHSAIKFVHDGCAGLGGTGIVGMTIDQTEEEVEVSGSNDNERTDMIFTFHAIGTAIAELADQHTIPAITPTVNLRTRRPGVQSAIR